jgi:hypothetical protein
MDRPKQQKRWKWVIGLVIGTVCGLVAAPSVQAAVYTSCSSAGKPQIMSYGFTTTASFNYTFLDSKTSSSSPRYWLLILRVKNPSTSSKSYSYTQSVTVAGKTCTAGPAFLTPGATGTKNCTFSPEPTQTGYYTLSVSASPSSSLQWLYSICQY